MKPSAPTSERRIQGPPGVVDPDLVIAHPETEVPPRPDLLRAMAQAFAHEEGVADGLLDSYAHHAELLLAGNRRMNLTAHPAPSDVAVINYLDSWRASRLLPFAGRSVLDLGAGAGFPGYPIALAEPSARVVLCDALKSRAEFVQQCIDAMGTKNVSCVWDCAEDHLALHRYDVVIWRGVKSVREDLGMLHAVRDSFEELVMVKGPWWTREVGEGAREAERLGLSLDQVLEHELPASSIDPRSSPRWGNRAVLVYRARARDSSTTSKKRSTSSAVL